MHINQAAQELRQKSALYRRLASVPTTGGSTADRLLIKLAEQCEREAEALETADGRILARA
jgi:hypothetical protein